MAIHTARVRGALLALALPVLASNGAQISTFQAGTGGWHLGTLAAGDVVGDGRLEIVAPYRDNGGVWKLDAFDWRGNRLPGFPYNGGANPINLSPTLHDVDGDGRAEIFFTAGASVVGLRGDGTVLWTRTVSALNYVPDSGFMAITNGFYMSPLGLWQPTLPVTAQFYSEVSPPILADLAGNGTLEILTAWKIKPDPLLGAQDHNPFINDLWGGGEWGEVGETWSGGVLGLNARTGAATLTYHFHQLVEAGLAVGQADGGMARKVYALNDADSVAAFDRTKPHGFHGKGMLHGMFGKNQRLLSGSYLTGVDVHVADVDGDGREEALVASTQINPNWQASETMLDDDGAILWRKWLPTVSHPTTHGWFNSACMIPVNPDHDNQVDVLSFTQSTAIAFRTWNGVELVDRPGWPKDFAPRLPTPPVAGDIDGDGEEEIIIGTYDPGANPSNGNLHVFALDGTQKLVLAVPGGLKHIPSIADVNGDGSVDVVYRALDGRVHVQNFGATPNARVSWATHRGNARRDGNMGRDLYPAGTPRVDFKEGGLGKYALRWKAPDGGAPLGYRVSEALSPGGTFAPLAGGDLPSGTLALTHFTGGAGELGRQRIFEVAAVFGAGLARSAPVAITGLLNNNLIANGGFEENDNSHWDKWFTGDIPWGRMTVSTGAPGFGRQAMEIKLLNSGSQSSITQYSHYGVPESYLKTTPGTLYSFGGHMRSPGISAASEHWFEWDSARTGEEPGPRPGLPWPNYFTPPLRLAAGAASGWKYLNRVFEMPAGFPNAQLRHRFTVQGRGTGSVFLDNVFFRPLPGVNDPSWQVAIPFGATWQWTADAPADGSWSAGGPVNWPSAPAKFGAGSGPQGIRTAVPGRRAAYYFRRSFSLATTNLAEILMSATCTDDYGGTVHPMRLFLNGQELETGPVEAVSGEGNVVKHYDLAAFREQFRQGTNWLGVILQNAWAADWDNVAFDVAMKVVANPPGAPRFVEVVRLVDGTVRIGVEGTGGSRWRLESSDDLKTWSLVEEMVLGNDANTVADHGQNGRPHPAGVPARYYRLRSP